MCQGASLLQGIAFKNSISPGTFDADLFAHLPSSSLLCNLPTAFFSCRTVMYDLTRSIFLAVVALSSATYASDFNGLVERAESNCFSVNIDDIMQRESKPLLPSRDEF